MRRKYDDSVKSGVGIDRSKGQSFTKDYAQDPWSVVPAGGNERRYNRNAGSRAGDKWMEPADSVNVIRSRPDDFQFRAEARSVWDDTCSDEGNGEVNAGFSGPIRYGVNKSQS